MSLLEILIPTYNRPFELAKCLESLNKSLKYVSKKNQLKIGIVIRNNSTNYYKEYDKIFKKFSKKFNLSNISYFKYYITGFNIGAHSNILGGVFNSKSQYIWILPDDDLARFDSLSLSINIIEKYKPSFISGGCEKKSFIKNYYTNKIHNDDFKKNKILDITSDKSKINKFLLSGNTVQLQEYIYKVELFRNFIRKKNDISFVNNDMFPGTMAIYSLQKKSIFIRLKKSIGIFRHGNHKESEWRHLWWKFALIDWPKLSEKMYQNKWLNYNEMEISKKVFTHIFKYLSWRLDILLGLNFRSQVNPILLLKYHGYSYIWALLISPFSMIKELSKRFLFKKTGIF